MTSAAETRSARKRAAILDAARTVFLGNGYAGANLDQVAALAATSKRTIYDQFQDKEGLFTAVITADIHAAEQRSLNAIEVLADTDDLAKDLRTFARQYIAIVTQPHLLRLRRLVIGEAERFPDLANAWYASGPERGQATLARVFRALARRGLLAVPDPQLAAEHFNWLVLSIPLSKAMFRPAQTFSPDELDRLADEGTRVFLAAYR